MPTQNFDGVTAPALPAGGAYYGDLVTSAAWSNSAPNSLAETTVDPGALHWFFPTTTADSFGGDVTVSATANFAGTQAAVTALLARSSALNVGGNAYYFSVTQGGNSSGAHLGKFTGGTESALGNTVPGGQIGTGSYLLSLTLTGSALAGYQQRVSDGLWLRPDGTFSAGKVACCTATDSSITGAGFTGGYFYAPVSGSAPVYADDFSTSAYSAPPSPPAATVIAVDNPALYFSADNWRSDGSGAFTAGNIHASSTVAVSNTPGAYLKTVFVGTSCKINLDMSALTGANTPAGYYPTVRWSIDGGAYSSIYTLLSTDTALTLASGLSSGNHTLLFQHVSAAGGTASTPDRYTGPVQALRVVGLTLDGGATVSAYTPLPRILLTTGDSYWEGIATLANTALPGGSDSFNAPGWALATAFGCEWSNRSLGGGGWTVGGSGGVPPYYNPADLTNSWWDKYSAGKPLLVGGLLPQQPWMWLNGYGINDQFQGASASSVTASALGWLPKARAAAPLAWIGLVVPAGQSMRDALLAAFTSYQGTVVSKPLLGGGATYSGTNDPKCFLVDMGTRFPGLVQPNQPSLAASDGIHPLLLENTLIDATLAAGIQQVMTATIATNSTINALSFTVTKNGAGQNVFVWTAAAGVTSYKLLRTTDGGLNFTRFGTTQAGTTTFTETDRPSAANVGYAVIGVP